MTNTCSDRGGEADDLAALVDAVRLADRHLARAVALAGRLAASGAAERVEGLPLDLLLGLAGRMTGADQRTLIAAGEVLTDLPVTAALFASGSNASTPPPSSCAAPATPNGPSGAAATPASCRCSRP